jgi:hypothetical protein
MTELAREMRRALDQVRPVTVGEIEAVARRRRMRWRRAVGAGGALTVALVAIVAVVLIPDSGATRVRTWSPSTPPTTVGPCAGYGQPVKGCPVQPSTPAHVPPPAVELPFMHGSGSAAAVFTPVFTVPRNWTLHWSYDCAGVSDPTYGVNVDDATTGQLIPNDPAPQGPDTVTDTRNASVSVEPVGGTIRIGVYSDCTWTLEALSR